MGRVILGKQKDRNPLTEDEKLESLKEMIEFLKIQKKETTDPSTLKMIDVMLSRVEAKIELLEGKVVYG